jgi:hypothetical protein
VILELRQTLLQIRWLWITVLCLFRELEFGISGTWVKMQVVLKIEDLITGQMPCASRVLRYLNKRKVQSRSIDEGTIGYVSIITLSPRIERR